MIKKAGGKKRFKLYKVGKEYAGRTIKGVGYDHRTMSSQRYGVRYRCGHEAVLRHIEIKRATERVTTGLCQHCASKAPRIDDTDPKDLIYPAEVKVDDEIRTHNWPRPPSGTCEHRWVNVR